MTFYAGIPHGDDVVSKNVRRVTHFYDRKRGYGNSLKVGEKSVAEHFCTNHQYFHIIDNKGELEWFSYTFFCSKHTKSSAFGFVCLQFE